MVIIKVKYMVNSKNSMQRMAEGSMLAIATDYNSDGEDSPYPYLKRIAAAVVLIARKLVP